MNPRETSDLLELLKEPNNNIKRLYLQAQNQMHSHVGQKNMTRCGSHILCQCRKSTTKLFDPTVCSFMNKVNHGVGFRMKYDFMFGYSKGKRSVECFLFVCVENSV